MNSCSSMLDPEPYVGLQVWRAVNSRSSMLDMYVRSRAVRRFARQLGSEVLYNLFFTRSYAYACLNVYCPFCCILHWDRIRHNNNFVQKRYMYNVNPQIATRNMSGSVTLW